jgi:hypothetical protein
MEDQRIVEWGYLTTDEMLVQREYQEKYNCVMKKDDYELRDEYELSKMTVLPKGRFDPKRRIRSNVIILEPEIAKAFPNDEAVNEALRLILKATKISQEATASR